jgi:bisanhydrobacterioruberin hydratase
LGIVTDTYKDFFIGATPLNLLLMFALLLATGPVRNRAFWLFAAICTVVGIGVEWIGVNTGLLFGQYAYGTVLGYRWQGVPLLIGINWFVTIYCCGITVHTVMYKFLPMARAGSAFQKWKALGVVVDGATLAVFFDWVMEPVAVKLGFWAWGGNGAIPMYNYLCWFGISLPLMACFHWFKFDKANKFAVHLLLVQTMFFLVLRTFL